MMSKYDDKDFKNISSDELNLETEEEKEEAEKQVEDNKDYAGLYDRSAGR